MISIIVPIYNVQNYILKCLESLEKQNLNCYEVIVIDDGSSDNSARVAQQFCEKNKNFHLYSKSNGGLISAWLEGLKKSKGEYIGFVDGDDYVEENMFSCMYNVAVKTNVDMVMCNHVYEYESKSIIHKNPIKEGEYNQEEIRKMIHLFFPSVGKTYVSPSRVNKIIRKDILLKNLKYLDTRVSSGEDINIILPCFMTIKSLYYINQPFYHYIQRKTSISNTFNANILDNYDILINKIKMASEENSSIFSQECDKLRNFYGYLWYLYVVNSSLTIKEKISQMNRVSYNKKYIEASKYCQKDINNMIYVFSIRLKLPVIFIIYEQTKQIVKKIKKIKKND